MDQFLTWLTDFLGVPIGTVDGVQVTIGMLTAVGLILSIAVNFLRRSSR